MNGSDNKYTMKKLLTIFAINILLLSGLVLTTDAQMMMGGLRSYDINWNEVIEHTLREEQEGKELWEKLQSKEIACANLDNEQFGVLGEYFMSQMMEDSHAAMNAMMIQAHGEEGEEQIHIVVGKRLSGCDTSAAMPGIEDGWMPMINMMTGRWSFDNTQDRSFPFGSNSINNMMNFGTFGFFSWIFMILWWILIIAGVVALIKWVVNQLKGDSRGKSALDILKERYIKGEIDKKEFEEKKKDLVA